MTQGKKNTLSPLEKFLEKRRIPYPVKLDVLLDEMKKIISEIHEHAGKTEQINGAIRHLLLKPMRSVAEDLESFRKLAECDITPGTQSVMRRWLVTPNFRGGNRELPRRIAAWYPNPKSYTEKLYQVLEPNGGYDFVIWNTSFEGLPHFRACPAKLFSPKSHPIATAPKGIIKAIKKLAQIRKSISTTQLRLSLAMGDERTQKGWIALSGSPKFKWWSDQDILQAKSNGQKLPFLLPQSYVRVNLNLLGAKFGVDVVRLGHNAIEGDGTWITVNWKGSFAVQETIRAEDWLWQKPMRKRNR